MTDGTYRVAGRDRAAHAIANAVLRVLASPRYRAFVTVLFRKGQEALDSELAQSPTYTAGLALGELTRFQARHPTLAVSQLMQIADPTHEMPDVELIRRLRKMP